MWRRFGSWLLDLLYPPSCVLCEGSLVKGRSLCEDCRKTLPRLEKPFCDSCGQPYEGQIEGAFDCPNCGGARFAFSFARPAMRRDERTLEMIHRLKYQREIHLAGELGRLAGGALEDPRLARAVKDRWPLLPVPLHRKRMRWRHFNQAAEIARAMGMQTGLPVLHGLKRLRSTSTQTALGRKQRLVNLRGAFALTRAGKRWLTNKPAGVLLIDDVLTTGSTAHECARTLKRAGVKQVIVVTVMRG